MIRAGGLTLEINVVAPVVVRVSWQLRCRHERILVHLGEVVTLRCTIPRFLRVEVRVVDMAGVCFSCGGRCTTVCWNAVHRPCASSRLDFVDDVVVGAGEHALTLLDIIVPVAAADEILGPKIRSLIVKLVTLTASNGPSRDGDENDEANDGRERDDGDAERLVLHERFRRQGCAT